MRLSVEWVHATRPPEVARPLALTFRNAVLDYFGGSVEQAKQAHDRFTAGNRGPFSDWAHAIRFAHTQVRDRLTPTEAATAGFKAWFH